MDRATIIGVDARSGPVHTSGVTSSSVHDVTENISLSE